MKAGSQAGPSIVEGKRGNRLVKIELERPRGSSGIGWQSRDGGVGWGAGPVFCLLLNLLLNFLC